MTPIDEFNRTPTEAREYKRHWQAADWQRLSQQMDPCWNCNGAGYEAACGEEPKPCECGEWQPAPATQEVDDGVD